MRKIAPIILCLFLFAGCAKITLKKGDMEFSASKFMQESMLEGLEAENVNGMSIKLNKRTSESKEELIKALLKEFLK